MSRHLDLVRSFLEQLEARDLREGAILAREFSVSDTPATKAMRPHGCAPVQCESSAFSSRFLGCLLPPALSFPLPALLSRSHTVSLSAFRTLPTGAQRGEVYRCLGGARHTLVSVSHSRSSLAPDQGGGFRQGGRQHTCAGFQPTPRPFLGHLVIPGRKWFGAAKKGTRKLCRPYFELQEF